MDMRLGVVPVPVVDPGGGVRMAGFADPDGNTWTLQDLAWRSQGHAEG